MTRTSSSFITYDPTKKHFALSPIKSIHQRDAFVKSKLNPSLNVLKHVKEDSECNKSLCS
jgi:hypothetical protein